MGNKKIKAHRKRLNLRALRKRSRDSYAALQAEQCEAAAVAASEVLTRENKTLELGLGKSKTGTGRAPLSLISNVTEPSSHGTSPHKQLIYLSPRSSPSSSRKVHRCFEQRTPGTPQVFVCSCEISPQKWTPSSLTNAHRSPAQRTPSTPQILNVTLPSRLYDAERAKSSKRRLNICPDEPRCDETEEEFLPNLNVEIDSNGMAVGTDVVTNFDGRRGIVDLAHFVREIERMGKHHLLCTGGAMTLQKVSRKGLVNFMHYMCEQCNKSEIISTEANGDLTVNTALVCGSLGIGIGHSQVEELFANINIPCLTQSSFRDRERDVNQIWTKRLADEMDAALEEEKALAIAENRVDSKGRAYFSVIVDGGWAKRSYRHSYSSNSGLAVIIGARTGRLLYLGVKNRFCFVCAKTEAGEQPTDHRCNRNYQGSSTAMEQEVIVEGLKYIFDTKNMWPKYVIGDGDSSVFARIRQSFGEVGPQIMKVECTNHIRKNYRKKLSALADDTKLPKEGRDILKSLLLRFVSCFTGAIKRNIGNAEQMKVDLKNGVYHVLGDHTKCDTTRYCTRADKQEKNLVEKFKSTGFLKHVSEYVDYAAILSPNLVTSQTTNPAESLMSKVAKFTGGKRIDFCKGKSYQTRCIGAGLSKALGPSYMIKTWRSHFNKSIGIVGEKLLLRRQKLTNTRRNKFLAKKAAGLSTCAGRYNKKIVSQPDADYGKPDVSEEILQDRMQNILAANRKRVSNEDDREKLEKETREQAECEVWKEVHHWLLTSADFGKIIKMRPDTSCHSYLQGRMSGRQLDNNEAIIYGRVNEEKARVAYQEKTKRKVIKSGIFVDPKIPDLGASPDGIIESDDGGGSLEIKCLHSIKHMKLREALLDPSIKQSNLCFGFQESWDQKSVHKSQRKPVDPSGPIILKPNHNYWYQVQGQMALARKQWCDFVLYTDVDMEIIRVNYDPEAWEKNVSILQKYYRDCLLPELADSRTLRHLQARDPDYIQEAKRRKEKEKKEKEEKAEQRKEAKLSKASKKKKVKSSKAANQKGSKSTITAKQNEAQSTKAAKQKKAELIVTRKKTEAKLKKAVKHKEAVLTKAGKRKQKNAMLINTAKQEEAELLKAGMTACNRKNQSNSVKDVPETSRNSLKRKQSAPDISTAKKSKKKS